MTRRVLLTLALLLAGGLTLPQTLQADDPPTTIPLTLWRNDGTSDNASRAEVSAGPWEEGEGTWSDFASCPDVP